MPRARDESESITSAVRGLIQSVTALVEGVHGAMKSAGVSAAANRVGASARQVGAAAAAKSAKLKSSLKSYWARLTPEQKRERVDAILRGRGLLPKKRGARVKRKSAA